MAAQAHQAEAPPCAPPTPMRRRGEVLEHAIFDAVLEELREVGYGGVTMEGVAHRARTGKAALYRRWPSKDDLLVDALHHALPPLGDPPDHGNVRDDVLDAMRRMADLLNAPGACAVQCLLAEVARDKRFKKLLHERVLAPREQLFHAVLARAAERGEIRAEALGQLSFDIGPALLVQRFLADGPPVPDDFVVSVVDDVVLPLLRS